MRKILELTMELSWQDARSPLGLPASHAHEVRLSLPGNRFIKPKEVRKRKVGADTICIGPTRVLCDYIQRGGNWQVTLEISKRLPSPCVL